MKTPLSASQIVDMKRDAKRIARAGSLSHSQALEQLAREAGFSSWHEASTTALQPATPPVTREGGTLSMVVPGTSLRMQMQGDDAETEKLLREHVATMQRHSTRQQRAHEEGVPALERLFAIAQRDSGQCRHVAAFLLGLYNGQRFAFDLTNFRAIDEEIFEDCMRVLRMDAVLLREVHTYFPDGGRRFEALARRWGISDLARLRSISRQIVERGVVSFGGEEPLESEIRHALANTFAGEDES